MCGLCSQINEISWELIYVRDEKFGGGGGGWGGGGGFGGVGGGGGGWGGGGGGGVFWVGGVWGGGGGGGCWVGGGGGGFWFLGGSLWVFYPFSQKTVFGDTPPLSPTAPFFTYSRKKT